MDDPKVDIVQLQKRDPQAWTALLSVDPGLADVVVTAVTTQPLTYNASISNYSRRVSRIFLSLANHTDPITLIAKQTTVAEALFYRDLSSSLPYLAPKCWLAHVYEDRGWVVLDDVPNDQLREKWTPNDVEDVIGAMARFHAAYWDDPEIKRYYPWLNHFVGREERTWTWPELRKEHTLFFEEGPAAILSDHALLHVGRLAPQFLIAANGLAVLRALGGWPGVLGESHLAALGDLLDDPVPVLQPLINLPVTLLHGDPQAYHWHLTMFDQQRLLDWREISVGPGIYDLILFQERFDLLFNQDGAPYIQTGQDSAATGETIVDSYMLAMKDELGDDFDARSFRKAISAARCLMVLTKWLPFFASWFDQMPNKYTWQRVNRMSEAELVGRSLQPLIGYRPYLRGVFQRFLQAYRLL